MSYRNAVSECMTGILAAVGKRSAGPLQRVLRLPTYSGRALDWTEVKAHGLAFSLVSLQPDGRVGRNLKQKVSSRIRHIIELLK